MRLLALLGILAVGLGLRTLQAGDGNWPQFRGPNASGVADDRARPPVEIGPKKHVAWQREIPPGHSSPIVFGNRVYVTAAHDKKLTTIAIDRNAGTILWQADAPFKAAEKIHSTGSLAQSSPATDGERIVSFFGSSGLTCYDRDGKQLWHRPFGPFKNDFGAGSSPIFVGDLVLLNLDHDSDSALLALDKRTGETVWKADRSEFRRGYATPVVWNVDGRKQVVVAGTVRVVGYDLETGKEIWNAGPIARLVNPTPVIGPDNVLYVTGWTAGGDAGKAFDLPPFAEMLAKHDANANGTLELTEVGGTPLKERFGQFDLDMDDHVTSREYEIIRHVFSMARNSTLAIRPGGKGDVSRSHLVWESVKGLPSLASPAIAGSRLFLLKEGGIATCLDVRDGKLLGQGRLAGGGRYYASPVIANGNIYAINQQGELTVVAATAEMAQVHGADFGEEVSATPAIVDGQIFVRTAKRLYCFDSRK